MGVGLSGWLNSVPFFPIVLGAGAVFSVLLSGRVARVVGLPTWVVLGLGLSLSLVAAATLSPAVGGIPGPCLRATSPPIDPRDLVSRSDRALNTWLFVPLGFFAGYAAVRRVWVLALAFAVPLVVEGVQRLAPVLNRRCQFQDLVDNAWGLVLGSMLGVAAALVAQRLSAETDRSA